MSAPKMTLVINCEAPLLKCKLPIVLSSLKLQLSPCDKVLHGLRDSCCSIFLKDALLISQGSFPQNDFVSEVSQDWDLVHFPKLKRYLEQIEDPKNKENARKVIQDYEDHVIPIIPSLRTGIIHGDLNGLNIVLQDELPADEGYHVAGFIDFNDAIKACVIFELGISLAHIMFENLHPVTCSSVVEFVGPMIRAYNSVFPLSAQELDCLYYLVLARCCQVAINSVQCFSAEPWNSYMIDRNDQKWRLIDYMLSVPKSEVDRIWSRYISGCT